MRRLFFIILLGLRKFNSFLATEPKNPYSKRLLRLAAWAILNLGGIVVSVVFIAPLIYSNYVPSTALASAFSGVVLLIINVLILGVKLLIEMYQEHEMTITYYFPILSFIGVFVAIFFLQKTIKDNVLEFLNN